MQQQVQAAIDSVALKTPGRSGPAYIVCIEWLAGWDLR